VAFNAYLAMLAWPMIAFGWVTNLWQRGTASWKRMLEVLDAVPSIAEAPASVRRDVSAIEGRIEFRHLSFAYGGRVVLKDVSLTIDAGQTVAFLGRTGSGKSTLISLVPRLHEPPPGTVLVDGIDVRDLPLDVLRRAVGFVGQEPFLFSDTIAENVAFGVPQGGHPDERAGRIAAAAAVARLDKDVEAFAAGYDTRVGERGITLSGGQKQRLSIARALLADRPILLLDEATSSLDAAAERLVQQGLEALEEGRTTLVIAHRLATVQNAGRIVVLERGEIAAQGTHAELMRQGGLYASLARLQFLGGKDDKDPRSLRAVGLHSG
jgi:ATP-binding cassette subfamily B protein